MLFVENAWIVCCVNNINPESRRLGRIHISLETVPYSSHKQIYSNINNDMTLK